MRRHQITTAALTAAAVATALLTLAGSVAHADDSASAAETGSTDVTAPVLSLPKTARFVADAQTEPMAAGSEGEPSPTAGVKLRATWSATDDAAVCGYKVAPHSWFHKPRWSNRPLTQRTSKTWRDDDYIDQEGGGRLDVPGYHVRAYDCAGNHDTEFVAGNVQVYQEDGQSYDWGTLPITYTGEWDTSVCECHLGGTAADAGGAGAAAQFRLPSGPMAVVASTGANSGELQVWVNGDLVDVVDTYRPFAGDGNHRVVVYAGVLPGKQSRYHTVRLVAGGPSGRSDVTLDAVMTNGYHVAESIVGSTRAVS